MRGFAVDMIHKVNVYKGIILKDDAQFVDPDAYYVLVHVTTLEEAQVLAESLE